MPRCVVLSARRFSFEGEKDKKIIDGVTVTYLDPGLAECTDQNRGTFPLNVSAPTELWPKLQTLPGVYDCEFRKRPGKNGRAVETLSEVSLIEAVNIDKIATAKTSSVGKTS